MNNNDARFKMIKSIYNEGESNSRAGRAQSPIISARLMIHPPNASSSNNKNSIS